jgi:hypothetical protein
MNIRKVLHSIPVSHFILHVASLLVPRQGRAEWLAEWKAELWQVCRARGRDVQEPTAFCMGAFQDAFWLRRNQPRAVEHSIRRSAFRIGSASRCGFSLLVLAATSLLICFCFAGTRKALLPWSYRNADGLVILSRSGYSGLQTPTIALSDYRAWKTNTRRLFTGLAYYRPVIKRVHLARHEASNLSIARASGNLFEVLDLPLSSRGIDRANHTYAARLILSRAAWHRYFGDDPDIFGRVGEIAGQPVLIAGVISEDSWRLPGKMDAWMLEDESTLNALPSNSKGFVLAHVKASAFHAQSGQARTMIVTRASGGTESFDCISTAQQARLPFTIFLFTILLASVALPATTPLPLGDYPERSDHPPRSTAARRWIFLAAKFALILPTIYFTSIDLAYSLWPMNSSTAIYIQLSSSFFGLLFAFRWALRDQRKRCPECLRLLSNPARVGHASHNFLAWNGMELICAGGHGMLHIPDIPTSWFSSQRWLYLDPSWAELFSEGYLPSTPMV